MTNRTEICNTHGLRLQGADNERLKDFLVYAESGRVMVQANVTGIEALQYLSPIEAMAFAKAFERCAIIALKEQA